MTGLEWIDLVCAWDTNGECVSGTQLGYIGSRIAVSVRRYDLAMVWHRSKNWKIKDGKMVLMAQPLLESRTCAYLEC